VSDATYKVTEVARDKRMMRDKTPLAGVACVVAPASFAQQAGLSVMPSVLTDIRARYWQ
jgi:hypothetical protein